MGLFYSKRIEKQDGKNFKVLRAKPIMHWIFILLLVFFVAPILYLVFTHQSLESIANYLIILGSIISLLFIIQNIEVWPFGLISPVGSLVMLNLVRVNAIIKKGSVPLSFSNPQELWIKDLTWL